MAYFLSLARCGAFQTSPSLSNSSALLRRLARQCIGHSLDLRWGGRDRSWLRYPPTSRTQRWTHQSLKVTSPSKPRFQKLTLRMFFLQSMRCLTQKPPIIHAGQGVLYANATEELIELAELLRVPVMTTLTGKSTFPEKPPLALGSGSSVMNGCVYHFLSRADVIFGIGTSLTKHGMTTTIPSGQVSIHATNDPIDIDKDYYIKYPIIGDAKLVLRQLVEACKDLQNPSINQDDSKVEEVASVKKAWLKEWTPKLTSDEVPITPYRVIWEFMNNVDPAEAIVTHDSGSPRDQLMPFYQSGGPRTYLGWGKSHGLGTGLGLNMGAKLAAIRQICGQLHGGCCIRDDRTGLRDSCPK